MAAFVKYICILYLYNLKVYNLSADCNLPQALLRFKICVDKINSIVYNYNRNEEFMYNISMQFNFDLREIIQM